MKHIFWIAILVLGVMIQGCGSQKPESRSDKKAFWIGQWKVNPQSIEKARTSGTGMVLLEDGSYQNGSYNKGKFYPMSKKGKWDLSESQLLIIDGTYTNKAVFSILSNQDVLLEFNSSRLFMSKIIKKED